MSPELAQHLYEKFPQVFQRPAYGTSDIAMCRDFAVQDGWYSLIDVLCEELQRETEQQGAQQVVATQVKKKFGGLRFYVEAASPRQMAMIKLAQALSYRICEVCGAPGTLDETNGRWMRTRCPAHFPVS